VDPVLDPLLLEKSCSAWNRTRTSKSVARNSDHKDGRDHRASHPVINGHSYEDMSLIVPNALPYHPHMSDNRKMGPCRGFYVGEIKLHTCTDYWSEIVKGTGGDLRIYGRIILRC
jgi:hypothetical protein